MDIVFALVALTAMEIVLGIDNIVFIAILAGTGSVVAPFLGSIIFGVIHSVAFDLPPNTWQLVLGTSLLLIIVFLPTGLWSLFGRRLRARG